MTNEIEELIREIDTLQKAEEYYYVESIIQKIYTEFHQLKTFVNQLPEHFLQKNRTLGKSITEKALFIDEFEFHIANSRQLTITKDGATIFKYKNALKKGSTENLLYLFDVFHKKITKLTKKLREKIDAYKNEIAESAAKF